MYKPCGLNVSNLCLEMESSIENGWIFQETDVTKLQMLLPQKLILDVLKSLHDHPTSAHLGVTKTLLKVRDRFYWPGQRRDVEDWCRTCQECSSRKSPSRHYRAKMSTDSTGNPLQRVAMDILGPLPVTERQNKYVLVISDYFTKWADALPLPNMEAETVAREFVRHFVCLFGAHQDSYLSPYRSG